MMFGSHVDTVATGGRYDGLLGVLAGLEACQALNDAGIATRRPLVLVAFTNEEGVRFSPYAMGSLVFTGALSLDEAYAIRGIDGASRRRRIASASAMPARSRRARLAPHAYLELHIEQGPVLEKEGLVIGAVEGITGLSWSEVSIAGRAATPAPRRCICAAMRPTWQAEIVVAVRRLAREMGGAQRGTVGRIEVYPEPHQRRRRAGGLDGRSAQPRRGAAAAAEREVAALLERLAAQENVAISTRSLGRFAPVLFPAEMVALVETSCARAGPRLPSTGFRRRPRCADDGAHLPGRHDLRAERRRAQPQRQRGHQARAPASRRRGADARGASPCGMIAW